MHKHKIILIISFFAIQIAQSQTCGLTISNIRPPQSRQNRDVVPPYFQEKKAQNDVSLYKFKNINRDSFALSPYTKFKATPSVLNPISFVFSVNNLPFFCKLEYKMGVEKQYPLKIRLGDVQYVDQLEGKNKNGNLH